MTTGYRDPKFLIAYTIIIGFAAAYINSPDDTMKGALIAAFAGAWGYYLGSSNSSAVIRDQMDKTLDLAQSVTSGPAAAGAQSAADSAQHVADELKDTKQ